ncbi:MAG: hypothetical protein LBQ12_10675 [Deltaproteobacteria bacterium]|nr:hypothetical protein [Deltaproteobacteria bacterium]
MRSRTGTLSLGKTAEDLKRRGNGKRLESALRLLDRSDLSETTGKRGLERGVTDRAVFRSNLPGTRTDEPGIAA